jgi:DNA polymerase-3 subunit gamma/tau
LLGAFSLDALGQVTQALSASDSARLLQLVDELERNGHNLQHFSRELSRYFRNLLVARIAGPDTRLIAASAAQRESLAQIASGFSEEDLTRYLQLSLDLFRDLQFSLQPRFHLELGLLRLVQAGRLVSIEEALAEVTEGAGGRGPGAATVRPVEPAVPASQAAPRRGPSPFEQDRAKKSALESQPPSLVPRPPSPSGDLRQRLHAALMELGMSFTADAIEHSLVVEANNEIQITTPKDFSLAVTQADIDKAVRQVLGRPMKLKLMVGEVAAQAAAPVASKTANEDEVTERALENPEVRRFRDVFGGEVRTVRNLKE